MGFLMAQRVKNLPVVQETWLQSLDWEDPLEKGIVTHYSILAWRIPWTEEPGGLQSIGSLRHDWVTNTFIFAIILLHDLTYIFQFLLLELIPNSLNSLKNWNFSEWEIKTAFSKHSVCSIFMCRTQILEASLIINGKYAPGYVLKYI